MKCLFQTQARVTQNRWVLWPLSKVEKFISEEKKSSVTIHAKSAGSSRMFYDNYLICNCYFIFCIFLEKCIFYISGHISEVVRGTKMLQKCNLVHIYPLMYSRLCKKIFVTKLFLPFYSSFCPQSKNGTFDTIDCVFESNKLF